MATTSAGSSILSYRLGEPFLLDEFLLSLVLLLPSSCWTLCCRLTWHFFRLLLVDGGDDARSVEVVFAIDRCKLWRLRVFQKEKYLPLACFHIFASLLFFHFDWNPQTSKRADFVIVQLLIERRQVPIERYGPFTNYVTRKLMILDRHPPLRDEFSYA